MNWRWYRKSSICECDDVSFHCIGNGKSRLIIHSYCAYEWNSVHILECYLDLIWYVLQVSFQILVQGILKYTNTKVDSFIQNNSSCCFLHFHASWKNCQRSYFRICKSMWRPRTRPAETTEKTLKNLKRPLIFVSKSWKLLKNFHQIKQNRLIIFAKMNTYLFWTNHSDTY